MAKHRVRMPLCLACGQRITRMRWDYHYVDDLHGLAENARKLKIQVAIATLPDALRKHAKPTSWPGYRLPIGRGYRGLNLFCSLDCSVAYISKLTPTWETL